MGNCKARPALIKLLSSAPVSPGLGMAEPVKDATCGLRAVSGFFGRLLGRNLVTNGSFSGSLGSFRPESAQKTAERSMGDQISAQKLTKKLRDGP